jgi:hypothetical protein
MLVKGNSGFGIELVDELTIRKSASGNQASRLQRQIEKQALFHHGHRSGRVLTPKILRTSATASAFHADMEFVAAKDFVQFLSEADRHALDDFSTVMADFVSSNLAASQTADVSSDIRLKLEDLNRRGVPAIYIKAAETRCRGPVSVPVGPCHGDLTLSNILFKSPQFYLLDFLDCYVESPLQDIAKLRQDTQFGWSLQLYQADFNLPRVQIALRYLDQSIEAAFASHDWYHRNYELFQFVNLMRVLPYCVESKTTELVTQAPDSMLKKFTSKSSS